MVRLGGAASPTYISVFRGPQAHFLRHGIELDWVRRPEHVGDWLGRLCDIPEYPIRSIGSSVLFSNSIKLYPRLPPGGGEEVEFAHDSPVEEEGFELVVHPSRGTSQRLRRSVSDRS